MIHCVHVDGPIWGIKSPFSDTVRRICKDVPGMAWDRDPRTGEELGLRMWIGYSDAVALAAGAIKAKGLFLDEKTIPPPRREGIIARNIADKDLRPYQRIGVEFLVGESQGGVLLADDCGIGKSAQSLRAARALVQKTLIIAPAFVRNVWGVSSKDGARKCEIEKWWPAAYPPVLPRGVKNINASILNGAKVVVINYDIVYAWAGALIDWGFKTLILDECHALSSEKSRRSIACRELAKAAKYVWGNSGTPMTNRPRDLWNVVETISPGRFGGFFSYGLRYAEGHLVEIIKNEKRVWDFNGKSNLPELNKRLQHFMLRRTKQDVRLEIPAKTRQTVDHEIPKKLRIAPDPEIIRSSKLLRQALAYAADGKLPAVIEALRSTILEGHSVVAFTYRRNVAEKLVNALAVDSVTCGLIHGGVSIPKRQAIVDSKPQLLACTIDSCAVGVDFSYADCADFVELTWEPHELLQAESRLHRWGQTKPVLIRYHIAQGTADDLIATICIDKLQTFETTIGETNEGLAEDLTGGDSAEMVLAEMCRSLEKAAKAQAREDDDANDDDSNESPPVRKKRAKK